MTPNGTRPAPVPDPAARRAVCAARRPDACRGARTAGERALGRLCARALQCAGRDRGCATIYEVPAALAARGSGPRRPNCAASAPASTCGAMQGWRANGAPRRISARTRPGAFVLAHSDHVEPATARFAGSWWRFGALAGHNALKIGHPASNCAVVLQVSGFLMFPVLFQSIVLVLAAYECIYFKFSCSASTSEACQGHQSIFQPSDLVLCTFYVLKNTPNHAFRVCICGAFGPDGTVKNMKSDCDTCCDVRIIELLAVRKNLQCPWI